MTDRLKRDLERPSASGQVLRFPTAQNLVDELVDSGGLPRPDVLENTAGLPQADAEGLARLTRAWISAGQTGCLYAAALAKPAADGEDVWSAQVVAERLDDVLFALVVDSAMRGIGSADVMMLVFPYVRDDAALADLVGQLVGLPDWWWEDRSRPQDRVVRVGLRWLLPDRAHVSWVLGFAPMPWVPFTRRAPATALVMRVQTDAHTVPAEEPEDGLRGVHLAHMAHGMGENGAERGPVWTKTEEKKRTLLWDDLTDDGKLLAARLDSDDPDGPAREMMGAAWNVLAPHAKAKVTFALQRELTDRLPPAGRAT